jgi:hypothetical protein
MQGGMHIPARIAGASEAGVPHDGRTRVDDDGCRAHLPPRGCAHPAPWRRARPRTRAALP